MDDLPADGATSRRSGWDLADEVRSLIAAVNRSAADPGALEAARDYVAAARRALEAPDRRRG